MVSSIRKVCTSAVQTRVQGQRFLNFPTLRTGFKKVRLQDPFGRSAKTMQTMCVYTQNESMWMAPKQSLKDVLAYLDFFCNKCNRQQNIATQSFKS